MVKMVEIGANVQVDGFSYAVAFLGFEVPMDVRMSSGGQARRLWPWTMGEHLAALADCTRPTAEGLTLDSAAYAERVLAASAVPEQSRAELAPLALWWASGGGGGLQAGPLLDTDGWLDLGGPRARLRPWTAGERFAALAQAAAKDPAGGATCDPVGFLRTMLRHSVTAIDPPMPLDDLDSAATARLLAALMAINDGGSSTDATLEPDTPEAARLTLRLCRALGWTPSQVWATPAVELDRLLRLLDRSEAPVAAPPPSGLTVDTNRDHAPSEVTP